MIPNNFVYVSGIANNPLIIFTTGTKIQKSHGVSFEVAEVMKRKHKEIPASSDDHQHRKTKRLKKYPAKAIKAKPKGIQPHIPKSPGEISSNWKVLQTVCYWNCS